MHFTKFTIFSQKVEERKGGGGEVSGAGRPGPTSSVPSNVSSEQFIK